MQVKSEMSATVWKVLVQAGDKVEPGTELTILESMKMEIPVESETAGIVTEILVEEGQSIDEGDVIAVIE